MFRTDPFSDVSGNPNVTYAYNRRGLLKQVVDPTGTHDMAYLNNGLLDSEAHTGGVLGGLGVDHNYNTRLRRDYVQITGVSPSVRHDYEYDGAGRMWKAFEGTATHVTYGYLANSPLIQTATFRAAGSGGAVIMTTTKNYDYLNRLKDITSVAGSTFSHAYQYNSANQRTRATLQDSSYWDYKYDFLGQVTNGIHFWPDATFVAGQQFEYYFDHIGNRTKTRSGGDNYGIKRRLSTYTPNQLNQYSSRKVPGSVDIIGTAHADSTVTVDATATQRKGDYFRADVPIDNSAGTAHAVSEVRAVRADAGQDVMTNEKRTNVLAGTTQTFTYDDDGNLLTDGLWSYTWNAENRLLKMEQTAAVPSDFRKKLEFAYDYLGRRINKKIFLWNPGASPQDWATIPVASTNFVYDGWNLLAELNGLNGNAVVRSYMWGLDLSGSDRGAGGVGGLLAIKDSTATHFAAYDGNGNIIALVKTDGTISTHYEYGPFGETIRVTGSVSESNPFRFSTKYTDSESGRMCYPYRIYTPESGRWLSRDSIEEKGGNNLYAFVYNSPLAWFDGKGAQPQNLLESKDSPPSADLPKVSSDPDPCKTLAPWNQAFVKLGETRQCPTCGKASVTDVGKTLPTVVQDCILQHEKQHETSCPKLGFWVRCCPTSPEDLLARLCHQAKDEVAAYSISLKCAEEKLKSQSLTDNERKHLQCYLKNAEAGKKYYSELATKNKCK